jgi:RimJ/RimL family protein N-acetyltransferase
MTLIDRIETKVFCSDHSATIETERLLLRAPRLDDAAAITDLLQDRRIAENTARIPYPYSLADAETFIASTGRPGGELNFLVTRADGTVVGACGVGVLRGSVPEIGYWFGVPYWGKGYATETAHAVIDHAFTELGLDRLEGGARVSNPASRRVLEKCGFQWTGVGLYRVRAIASSAPCDRFRLDRGLWASLKSWGGARSVA